MEKSRKKGTNLVDTSSTNDTSISIEETNRIRAELGLKPLEVGGENSNVEASSEKKDIHVPAGNDLIKYIIICLISMCFLYRIYVRRKPQKS